MKKIFLFAGLFLFLLANKSVEAQNYNLALSPVYNPPLQVSCTVDKANVKINETVNYKVTATGGDGKYKYIWTTAPGLSLDKIEKKYASPGEKRETVKVSSSLNDMTVSCPRVIVGTQVFVPFSASCAVEKKSPIVGEEVLYKASVRGGDGKYVYSWSNGVGINSNTRSIKYETVGTKEMSVKVTSGKDTVEAKCPPVDVKPKYEPIKASCAVMEKKIHYVGDPVNWRVTATGGDRKYIYSWSEGVGISSNLRTIKYETPGTKSMSVKVSSANEILEVKCAPIEIRSKIQPLKASCTVDKKNIFEGESVTYFVKSYGGVKPHVYTWSLNSVVNDNPVSAKKGERPIVPPVDSDKMTTTYQTAGSKSMSVIVSSSKSGPSVEVKCPKVEVVKKTTPKLTASCTVDKPKALVGDTVTYRVVSSGGIKPHSYSWNVKEALNSKISNEEKRPIPQTDKFSISFRLEGYKDVSVLVNSSKSGDAGILPVSSGSPTNSQTIITPTQFEAKCPMVEIVGKTLPPITIDPNKFNNYSYRLEIVAMVFGSDSEIYKTVKSMIDKMAI